MILVRKKIEIKTVLASHNYGNFYIRVTKNGLFFFTLVEFDFSHNSSSTFLHVISVEFFFSRVTNSQTSFM